MMPVVPVRLIDKAGKEVFTSAFLDQGRSGCFVTSRLASQLSLEKDEVTITIDTVTSEGREVKSAVVDGAKVRGQECQRVYLAAQLLSERVARAVSHIFGDRYRKEAEFIALVDQAFDTFNSRHMSDGKLHRSAFGLAHAIEDQYSCLLKFTQVMRDSRVVGNRSMLSFQKGFVMSPTALRGLYSAVQRHHGISYLLTSRLNQDCVENCFLQALAYVTRYAAGECATVDSTLGKITSNAKEVPRDERYAWIDTLSRGGLTVSSARWLDQVEQLEVLFTTMHGGDIDRGTGVVRRLAEAAARKFPQLHPYVLRKYAMTRTELRVRGQECQRVYLAAQLLSERVAKAVSHIFGDRYRKEAEFIALDQAFDTFNSRHMSDGKLKRSAFGLAHAIEDQYSCLLKFTQVMRDARVVGNRSMLPFQKGFVMSSAALRGLYSAVQRHHEISYLLSRLNQDCVENCFSQALAYVAGYVAAKCATVDSTLGKITSDAKEEPRDERYAWIDTLSRGGLTVPSARWLEQVEQLEVLFTNMHGGDIDRGPGVVRRLAEAAALKFPQLHPHILRRYAMTRTQLRIREIRRLIGDRERLRKEQPTCSREAKRARLYVHPGD
ncbi:Transposable element P transposase [Amphibalanus amphitrite]|uniref:Transposable element P transposase n=1 Tax=Amphibalanus amphitrite TaxID=1232801 RepID=A0A6A4VUE1_AMPAM|nr:Transposable element P transposase [Amphibalanus amphitrite]